MKKILVCLVLLTIVLTSILPLGVNAASNSPKRVINVVYDDSGSMIKTNGVQVDTWCQAKYSMEVFAAMLGDNDTMNIYYMSDFVRSSSGGPQLSLKGADGASVNVSKVHEKITRYSDTPFNAVRAAYNDLTSLQGVDEKWLVVLTDGEFQGISNINDYFAQKTNDVKVMFLGMGPYAQGGVNTVEAKNIFSDEAKTSSDILKKITDISTRIFNSDRLEVNLSSKAFSFDVPMSQLVVFAQGANVSIKGIKDKNGTLINSSSEPVSVKYSEKSATNSNEGIVAKNLVGSIATFKNDFNSGDYTVDVTGAETIEIYYKPNVEIAAYLKDSDGNEVTNLSDLEAGDYTIEFGFVKGGTKDKVGQSKLLGKVSYEAVVTNNGKKHDKQYNSGDKIKLEEGSLAIDVTAKFLDYNSVSTHLDYTIFKNKSISFEIADSPVFKISKKGIDNSVPLTVKATIDGKEFTKEQWEAMGIPKVDLADSHEFKMGDFKVEKSDQIGIFNVYPTLRDGKPTSGTYSDCNLRVSYDGQIGNESWTGTSTGIPLKMQDERNWFERNKGMLIRLGILLIILIILFGYVPGVKKYLPKSLKSRPSIKAEPKLAGKEVKYYNGRLDKNLLSSILPYIPQTCVAKYVPSGVFGFTKLELKATSNKKMILTNTKDFIGKDKIQIAGRVVPKDSKKIHLTAGAQIKASEKAYTYICQLNKEKK